VGFPQKTQKDADSAEGPDKSGPSAYSFFVSDSAALFCGLCGKLCLPARSRFGEAGDLCGNCIRTVGAICGFFFQLKNFAQISGAFNLPACA